MSTGKSAIAAAIQLCLGANTRATGRGANLHSLIREGSSGPAILQVTLFNEGPDAYHPEKYGNRIMVERRIPKTGAATYHLKGNPSGRDKFEVWIILIEDLKCNAHRWDLFDFIGDFQGEIRINEHYAMS